MKPLSLCIAAALSASIGCSSPAIATDYIVGGGSGGDTEALFRISTDGKTGLLSYLDIVSVTALATPDYPAIFPGAQLQGDVLTATPTAMFYDFDVLATGHLLLVAFLPGEPPPLID